MMRWAGALCLALAACAAPVSPGDDGGLFEVYRDRNVGMTVQTDLDVDRYLGRWFEIARYPVVFERGCATVTAHYERMTSDRISVMNVCRDIAGSVVSTISGYADVVAPGKLAVTFPSVPFGGGADYWVLWVDPDYQVAVVGAPNGRSGWILARSQTPNPDLVSKARSEMAQNGYDLDRLLSVPQMVDVP